MKRVTLALAALAAATFLSAPAFARTTLVNFPGRPQGLEELLAHVHKHKHKVVVRTPGDIAVAATEVVGEAAAGLIAAPPERP